MSGLFNVSDVEKEIQSIYTKVSGVSKEILNGYMKVAGVAKKIYAPVITPSAPTNFRYAIWKTDHVFVYGSWSTWVNYILIGRSTISTAAALASARSKIITYTTDIREYRNSIPEYYTTDNFIDYSNPIYTVYLHVRRRTRSRTLRTDVYYGLKWDLPPETVIGWQLQWASGDVIIGTISIEDLSDTDHNFTISGYRLPARIRYYNDTPNGLVNGDWTDYVTYPSSPTLIAPSLRYVISKIIGTNIYYGLRWTDPNDFSNHYHLSSPDGYDQIGTSIDSHNWSEPNTKPSMKIRAEITIHGGVNIYSPYSDYVTFTLPSTLITPTLSYVVHKTIGTDKYYGLRWTTPNDFVNYAQLNSQDNTYTVGTGLSEINFSTPNYKPPMRIRVSLTVPGGTPIYRPYSDYITPPED